MKNYAERGGCYPLRLKAEVDNILRNKHGKTGFFGGKLTLNPLAARTRFVKPRYTGSISRTVTTDSEYSKLLEPA